MMQDSRPHAWCHTLLDSTDGVDATLEAVARYSLGSYTQHMSLLACPGLVEAVVGHIAGCSEPRSVLPGGKHAAAVVLSVQQCERAAAALEAAISLTVSKEGLQALVGAGAVEAAGVLLRVCCHNMGHGRCKKHRSAQDVTAACPIEDLHDLMDAALQLLASLFLNPSAARPAVGALDCEGVGATAGLLLQVLPGCWQLLSAKRQLDATAVLMRLAMEPGVAEQLCWQAVPVPDDTPVQPPVPLAAAAHDPAPAEPHENPFSAGLACLLGTQLPQAQFLASYWELQPVLCRASQQMFTGTSSEVGQHQEATQEPHPTFTGAVQLLASQLTPENVFQEVLPSARHCPVLDAAVDPVQVLHDLHDKGDVMQPLQLNTDLRLVQTQPAATTAAQCDTIRLPCRPARFPGCPCGVEHAPEQQPVEQHASRQELGEAEQQHDAAGPTGFVNSNSNSSAGQEVFCGLQEPVDARSCLAAFHARFTLVLRDMARRIAAVGLLVEALEKQLGLPAGANLYVTPAGAQGLQAHYDDHDVFVLQLSGGKRWLLGPPQHAPLPLTYQQRLPVMPTTFQAATQQLSNLRLPLHAGQQPAQQVPGACLEQQQEHPCVHGMRGPQEVVLRAGDCLYIPRGWVHQAAAIATACCTVGQGAWGSSSASARAAPATDPSSLHLSVGVEVEAASSVQGYLHHLIQVCADRACAASCDCNIGDAGRCNLPSQQLHPMSVSAAVLLLHTHLWRHAQACPAYRKACPLLAAGSAVQELSDAVHHQLCLTSCHSPQQKPVLQPDSQRAKLSLPSGAGAGAGAGAAAAATAAGPVTGAAEAPGQDLLLVSQVQPEVEREVPQGLPHQSGQVSHQWLAVAVQQLLQEVCTGTASMQPTLNSSHAAVQSEGSTPPDVVHLTSAIAQQAAQHTQLTMRATSRSSPCSEKALGCCQPLGCSCVAELLLGLARDVLGLGNTVAPGAIVVDGLLELSHWLEAANSSSNSRCPSCSSRCCHSARACELAVLALHMVGMADNATTGGPLDTLAVLLQEHVVACRCCQALIGSARGSRVGHGVESLESTLLHAEASAALRSSVADAAKAGRRVKAGPQDDDARAGTIVNGQPETMWSQLQHAALQVDIALVLVSRSMRCAVCRSHAAAGYVDKAQARLAGCQAVRRGFLAAAALARLL